MPHAAKLGTTIVLHKKMPRYTGNAKGDLGPLHLRVHGIRMGDQWEAFSNTKAA